MTPGEQQDFLHLLKTLADEQRLTMVQLMNERERTVSEMAERLKLSDPTVSHHVTKLHSSGLLRLRMAGNQRFYSLNPDRLNRFKSYAAEIEAPPTPYDDEHSDSAWIDALNWDVEDKKILRDYTFNGRLTNLPSKEKRMLVILRWLASKFEPGAHYTEKEVSAILTEVHNDYATLRRSLVEYGFMRRERGGGDYWLAPDNETNGMG